MDEFKNTVSPATLSKRKIIKTKQVRVTKFEKVDFSIGKNLPSIKSCELLDDYSDIQEMLSLLSPKTYRESNIENSTLDSEKTLPMSPKSNGQKMLKDFVLTPERIVKRKDFIIRKKFLRGNQAMTDR